MKALCESSPRARRHFTRLDQVEQLVEASEANPDTGFMARLLALCSLPRPNPGRHLQYKRVALGVHAQAGCGSGRWWQPGRAHAASQPDEAAFQRSYPAGLGR